MEIHNIHVIKPHKLKNLSQIRALHAKTAEAKGNMIRCITTLMFMQTYCLGKAAFLKNKAITGK